MVNYEHEIICPDNKGIRNYLWYDYFHDSKIDNIAFGHRNGLVILTLTCNRDIEDAWNKMKGDSDARSAYIDQNIDRFTYILTFKGTKYFHGERLIMVNDYINGRFKDTALLRKLATENKKPLYHLRIQIDDGFLDIVFSSFMIKKKAGRIKYPVEEVTAPMCNWFDEDAKRVALDGDDFERFLAMRKLFQKNDPALLEIARKNLWLDDDGDACLYSAYLLGKFGDRTDIQKLLELYLEIEDYWISKSVCRCSILLPKRNLLDAIELIYDSNREPLSPK